MAEVTKPPLAGGGANGGDAPTTQMPAVPRSAPAAPLVDVSTDRCPNCGADLAVDQRYCVECGYRRGKPRYTLAPPEPVVPAEPVPVRTGPVSRFSPGAALLAGLLCLLLALGVGVLIGHSGNNSGGKQPVNVTVGGGSGTPSANAGPASSSGQTSSSTSGRHKSSSGSAKTHTTAKPLPAAAKTVVAPPALKKAANIASQHVTSTTGQNSIGSKCSGGPGCQNGKQTGNFFGGG